MGAEELIPEIGLAILKLINNAAPHASADDKRELLRRSAAVADAALEIRAGAQSELDARHRKE